jgi:hypothetical protein
MYSAEREITVKDEDQVMPIISYQVSHCLCPIRNDMCAENCVCFGTSRSDGSRERDIKPTVQAYCSHLKVSVGPIVIIDFPEDNQDDSLINNQISEEG